MTLRPEEIEELLGAYALDAVDDDERRQIEEYLATNPRARAELQQHREVATMLAITGAPAPEGLWDRIAASIEGQAPEPGPELAKVLPHRRRPWGVIAAGAIAAVAAAVVAILGIGFVDRGRQVDRLQQQAGANVDLQRMFAQAAADPHATLVNLVSPDGALNARAVIEPNGTGFLAAQDLPALTDRVYQLWGAIGDKLISLGVLGPHPGVVTFSASGDLKALAVTTEQPGGVVVSRQPAALKGVVV